MRTLLFLSLICFFPTFAEDVVVTPGESVNPTEFFNRISGQYMVDLAGGEKPHEGTDVGLVMIDDTEGLLSFSYCLPDGMCDPNDQYFPLDKVNIVKTTITPASVSYELSFYENGTLKRFSWDETDNKIVLKNYQYMIAEKAITLEHQLHKRTTEEVATQIPATDFFNALTANYQVIKVQGEVPHSESVGRIEIIDNEGCMSFSYCSEEGACFPNDQYFLLEKTEVKSTKLDTGVLYEIATKDDDGERKYTLEENSGVIKLKNFQFDLNGTKTTLEHEAKRISDN